MMLRLLLPSLHSTMFLLILYPAENPQEIYITLHSTMFLLIRSDWRCILFASYSFTFHYVSINTSSLKNLKLPPLVFTFHYVSINTRFLRVGCK